MRKLKTEHLVEKNKSIAPVQNLQEETIRMNVNLSKSFYKQIKQKALDEDTNVTTIVKKALKQYMGQ